MKHLTIAAVVLFPVLVLPLRQDSGAADALWALGLLLLAAYLLQALAALLHLPDALGWLAAGLLLGSTGMGILAPQSLPLLRVAQTTAMLLVGLQVGSNLGIPRGLAWRGCLTMLLITVAVAALTAGALMVFTRQPWWMALFLGSLASLWGPFVIPPRPGRRGILLLGAMGTGVGLLLLSFVVILLRERGVLAGAALPWMLRVWISLLGGAITGAVLRWLPALRTAALNTVLAGGLVAGTLVIHQLALLALPCGFGAGLVLARYHDGTASTRFVRRSASPFAFMLVFAFLGASIDLSILWPSSLEVWLVVLVLLTTTTVVRWTGTVVGAFRIMPECGRRWSLGWLLLPHGIFLYELVLQPQHNLPALLGSLHAGLLERVMLIHVLFGIVVLSIVAYSVDLRLHRRIPVPSGAALAAHGEEPQPS